jgi:beta-glucanase (GH16 family)
VYDNKHAAINEGVLTIEAVRTANGEYRSSRIDTMNHWSFTHGRITATAKLPTGVGTWPALWLLPDERQTPRILAKHGIQDTPDSDLYYAWGGEVDMVEAVGWENKPVSAHMTVHSHASITAGSDTGISEHVQPITDGQTAFHEYSLTKRKGLIEFGVDGRTVHGVERQHGDTLADWPFDDYPYYFIANLAMGGTWGGRMKQEFPPNGIDDSQAPWKFQISELHFQPL